MKNTESSVSLVALIHILNHMEQSNTRDAPEVTGCEEPFEVTPSKMTVNILQDDVIEYTNFHFYITVLKYKAFKDHYPPLFCV